MLHFIIPLKTGIQSGMAIGAPQLVIARG